LEITETSLMGDAETSLLALRRLSEVGLKLAVDDFGTGYSSLWQLARLPVNVLKIDRAFIDGVDEKAENRLLVKAIVSLGRALNLGLVAEGVETSGQSAELASLGCDHAQGYFYHPPLMPDEFMEIYDRQVRSSN
jgi:EAL domain-containing protein (putative c-di-GMP-specific phosphodiesterase class I)